MNYRSNILLSDVLNFSFDADIFNLSIIFERDSYYTCISRVSDWSLDFDLFKSFFKLAKKIHYTVFRGIIYFLGMNYSCKTVRILLVQTE